MADRVCSPFTIWKSDSPIPLSLYQIVLVFAILIVYAIVCFFITVYFLSEDEVVYAIFYGMYVVETAIPPLIPTGMYSIAKAAEPLSPFRITFLTKLVYICLPMLYLPLVFLVSVGISADRLRRKRIATSDNREILVTGKVKMAFFDKTGTLVSLPLLFLCSLLLAPFFLLSQSIMFRTEDKSRIGFHFFAKFCQRRGDNLVGNAETNGPWYGCVPYAGEN